MADMMVRPLAQYLPACEGRRCPLPGGCRGASGVRVALRLCHAYNSSPDRVGLQFGQHRQDGPSIHLLPLYGDRPVLILFRVFYHRRSGVEFVNQQSRQGYIDHNAYSFESWLKIVEERFGVRSMTARDTDAADMLAAFDFTQKPRAPVILSASPTGSPYPPSHCRR